MKKNRKMLNSLSSLFTALSLLLTTPAAFAQDVPPPDAPPPEASATGTRVQTREKKIQRDGETVLLKERVVTQDNSVGTGVALFLGLDLGVIKSITELTDIETDKQGTQVGGRLVGSVYPENWVFDLGLGWFYSSISGQERLTDPQTGQRDEKFSDVKVITYAAFAELAGRYRLTKNWQLGLAFDAMFGEDLSFSSEANPAAVTGLVGLQLFYGVPEKTADIRWGLSAFTDITVPERQLYWVLLSVQLGLPLVKPDTIYREKSLVSMRDKVEREEVKKFVPKVVTKDVVKFVLHQDTLRFPPRKAILGNENQRFIIDLANTLKSVSEFWEDITVEGYVAPDSMGMGNESMNLRLSSARAAAVRNALVASGVSSTKAKSRGFGSGKPYDSTNALSALNERIELSFGGVTNAGRLNDVLNALQKRKVKPETCTAAGCK
ncbi:MAG: OmpA family protein [Silvanigrellales bacterium]|nr:OmpA family protein [Silvanigrellales bacterium]